jgi:hypothetical protein
VVRRKLVGLSTLLSLVAVVVAHLAVVVLEVY